MQWFGQSTMKVTTPGGKVIVIDPWLVTKPKTPADFKKLEARGKVDLILVSHAQVDHMADAPAPSAVHKVPVCAPAGLAPRFNKGGIVYPLGADTKIKLIATHAEHSSEYRWKNPDTGKDETRLGGEPIGFILELEIKPKFAIPIHYGTNPLLRGTPKEYMDALGSAATKVLPLEPGDKTSF